MQKICLTCLRLAVPGRDHCQRCEVVEDLDLDGEEEIETATDDQILSVGPVVCEVARHHANGADCPPVPDPPRPWVPGSTLALGYVFSVAVVVLVYLWMTLATPALVAID